MRSYFIGLSLVASLVLVSYSEVSALQLSLSVGRRTEQEKDILSLALETVGQAVLGISNIKEAQKAQQTLNDISKAAADAQLTGIAAKAAKDIVDSATNSVTVAIKAGKFLSDNIDKIMYETDAAKAIAFIEKVLIESSDMIFSGGVEPHMRHGAALARVGGQAKAILDKSLILLEKAGATTHNGVKLARQLCLSGIEAGGQAQVEALLAAKEALITQFYRIMDDLVKISKNSIRALKAFNDEPTDRIAHVSGIIQSLRTTVPVTDPEIAKIIAKLSSDFGSIVNTLRQQGPVDGINVLVQGISSAIAGNGPVIAILNNALAAIEQLPLNKKDAGTAIFKDAIENAKEVIFSSCSSAYLGIGAAGELTNKQTTNSLVPAIIALEQGRMAATDTLDVAEKILGVGLQNGGKALDQAFIAVKQIIRAALQHIYSQYLLAANIGFDAIKLA